MKKYELKYTVGEDGVFRMSTVESPALSDTQLVMFDDESKLLEFQDDEKRVIYSVAMRPNVLIPRKNINGEPAMVFYTEQTVRDLQQNFFKNNSHNGATINHDKNVRTDMYCFESWIVENPEKDKATFLGMSVEKGDWVLGQKVDNDEVWQKVKNKELTGFSIEAYLTPVLTENQIEMTKEEIAELVKVTMSEQDDEKKRLAEEEEEKLKMAEPPATEDAPSEPTKTSEEWQKMIDEKETEINDLKAKLAEYESKEVEMKAEIVEMKSEIEKGLKPNVKEKADSEMTAFEKFRQRNFNK
jgi:hypothetical protein